MGKLTAREKILLYTAAVFLLFAGGYYLLLLPSEAERLQIETELSIWKLEQSCKKERMEQYPVMEQELLKERIMAEEQKLKFPLYKTNSLLVPAMIRELAGHGLTAESIQVTDVLADEGEIQMDEGETEHKITEKEGVYAQPDKTETGAEAVVFKASVHISAIGTQTDFYSFLDGIEEKPWIAVTSYHISSLTDSNGTKSDALFQGDSRIRMTIAYYMLKLDEKKHVS